MLAQTTVAAVVPYYTRWFKEYPDIRSLARAPVRQVLKSWQGLGYYERARNLLRTAKAIVRVHGGHFPEDYEALRRLPGFGPYTAAAVLSLAFDRPYPVVEANVRRVLMRLVGARESRAPGPDRRLVRHLDSLFSRRKPGAFNQAMMELGALVCRPRSPLCVSCPVAAFCRAYKRGEQEIIPAPKNRTIRRVEAVLAVIRHQGRILIQKRPDKGLMAGLWEFPGGKVEAGESPEQALRREVREELGLSLGRIERLTEVRHSYTQFQVKLRVFDCALEGAPPLPARNRRWVGLRDLRRYPFPSGSAKVVDFLEKKHRIGD